MTAYTLHAAEAGTGIVVYEREAEDRIHVSAMERLPSGIDAAAAWLRSAFPAGPESLGEDTVTIDADGLGNALWKKLRLVPRHGWRLYVRSGRDRQELADALLVAISDRRISIDPSPQETALRKALTVYRRTVDVDGVIGGELVVALALAANDPKPRPALYVA